MNLLRNFNEFAEECAFCCVAKWWWLADYVAFKDDLETVVLCLVVLCGGGRLWRDDENRCTIGGHGKCRAYGS